MPLSSTAWATASRCPSDARTLQSTNVPVPLEIISRHTRRALTYASSSVSEAQNGTADIPLAAEVMANGAHALSPRGDLHSTETIRQRLNMRDFMDTLRASGTHTGGPPALSKSDRQSFANHLDKMLTRHAKG